MPLAHKTSAPQGPSQLPEALRNQISNNFKSDREFADIQAQQPSEGSSGTAAKSKYADSVNLRLTSGKRSEFKKFFTDCEISMNQGFEMAVDYVMREARAGRINVSKSGITKTDEI